MPPLSTSNHAPPRRSKKDPPPEFVAANELMELRGQVAKLRADVALLIKRVDEWAAWCALAVNRPWEKSAPPETEAQEKTRIPF